MTEMKLEEYFSNISYVRPSQHEYNIIINDKEKIPSLEIKNFHILTSNRNLFIQFNEVLPLFKINLEKNIELKEYFINKNENNILIIIIKEISDSEKIIKFQINKNYNKFFDVIFRKIYRKFKYLNYYKIYIENLKKKSLKSIELNFLINFKLKISKFKLNQILNKNYFKDFFNNFNVHKKEEEKNNFYRNLKKKFIQKIFFNRIKNNLNCKNNNNNKNSLLINKIFFNKIKNKIKNKKFLNNLIKNSIEFNNIHYKNKIIKTLKINNIKNKKNYKNSINFYNNFIKRKFINKLKNEKEHKKKIKNNIKKFNKFNFGFINLINEKLNKEIEYKNSKNKIKNIFSLLKNNLLKSKVIIAKYTFLIKKLLYFNHIKNLNYNKNILLFKRNFYLKNMHNLFLNSSMKIFYNKIIKKRKKFLLNRFKQKNYQKFFNEIVKNLTKKVNKLKFKKKWILKSLKFKLFYFMSNLFLCKQMKNKYKNYNKNNKLNVFNSFEIKSKTKINNKKKENFIKFQKKINFKLFYNKFLYSQVENLFKFKIKILKRKKLKEIFDLFY